MRIGEAFCPGVLHAVEAKDGLLLRIRVPGGGIEGTQLRALADLTKMFADGSLEITSRANLQLRAIERHNLPQITESLRSVGFLPSPQHDRVRNIVTSPIAGLDREEVIDPRPLIHELDRKLRAEPVFANLHPKFSFGIYGGPNRFSRDLDDIVLQATEAQSATYLHLSLGGHSSGFAVRGADAVECILVAARTCIELARECNVPVRTRAIMELPDGPQRVKRALSHLRLFPAAAAPPCKVNDGLLGIYATTQQDRMNIIPSVPLGRLSQEQAYYLADASNEWEADLRLAPWRGVVLGSISRNIAGKLVDGLDSLGLSCDGREGFHGISACAGITGCEASMADVRRDARSIAQRLAGEPVISRWTVNLSGCEKQCGRRHGATADLVAGPSGYTLMAEGTLSASDCPPQVAIEAIAALHHRVLSGSAAQ
ncbi:MAG TPA: precorrin-3B synthase [Acidobacteriaceae bacterium]|nr:precorrin-3B synthase [Acidobacteriaceae bacterium]